MDNNATWIMDVDYYKSSDTKECKKVFEFFKNNTEVEWSYTKVSTFGAEEAIISTSHDSDNEVGQPKLVSEIIDGNTKYDNVIDAIHTHSRGNIAVSYGDVKFANKLQNRYPHSNLLIYDGSGYYSFDKNSEPGLLPDVIITGTKK